MWRREKEREREEEDEEEGGEYIQTLWRGDDVPKDSKCVI